MRAQDVWASGLGTVSGLQVRMQYMSVSIRIVKLPHQQKGQRVDKAPQAKQHCTHPFPPLRRQTSQGTRPSPPPAPARCRLPPPSASSPSLSALQRYSTTAAACSHHCRAAAATAATLSTTP